MCTKISLKKVGPRLRELASPECEVTQARARIFRPPLKSPLHGKDAHLKTLNLLKVSSPSAIKSDSHFLPSLTFLSLPPPINGTLRTEREREREREGAAIIGDVSDVA